MSKLITPEFRGSFVNLTKPHMMPGETDEDKARYQLTVVLSKDAPFWKQVEAQIKAAAKEKWGQIPKGLKKPVKDGDSARLEDYEEFNDSFTIQVSTKRKPDVCDAALNPIMSADELYSGAWYRASIRAYAWQHPTGGKGVSFALDNVMKVRDDDAFGGSGSAKSDFADFAEETGDAEGLLD